MFFGWFVFFAGALVIGLAVLFAEDLPRGAGALLAVGSLLVLSVATVAVGGGPARPEALGPLLPFSGGVRGLVGADRLHLDAGQGLLYRFQVQMAIGAN